MAELNIEHTQMLSAIKNYGDQHAFSNLYNKFWEDLYRHAIKRINDSQAVEDLMQELFVQFWERRADIDIHMNLPAYLFGMLKYKVIDYYGTLKNQPQLSTNLAEHLHKYVQSHPDELETYLALEQILELELQKMSTNMQQAVLLRWEHCSIKEIAQKLNLSEQTVKNNLSEATRRLQKGLLNNSESVYGSLGILLIQIIRNLS